MLFLRKTPTSNIVIFVLKVLGGEVRVVQGRPGKSWNSTDSFSRPGKLWKMKTTVQEHWLGYFYKQGEKKGNQVQFMYRKQKC